MFFSKVRDLWYVTFEFHFRNGIGYPILKDILTLHMVCLYLLWCLWYCWQTCLIKPIKKRNRPNHTGFWGWCWWWKVIDYLCSCFLLWCLLNKLLFSICDFWKQCLGAYLFLSLLWLRHRSKCFVYLLRL